MSEFSLCEYVDEVFFLPALLFYHYDSIFGDNIVRSCDVEVYTMQKSMQPVFKKYTAQLELEIVSLELTKSF